MSTYPRPHPELEIEILHALRGKPLSPREISVAVGRVPYETVKSEIAEALSYLKGRGLVESRVALPQTVRKRKVYHLTPLGKAVERAIGETTKFFSLVERMPVNKGVLVDRRTGEILASTKLDDRVCEFVRQSTREALEILKGRSPRQNAGPVRCANIGVHLFTLFEALQKKLRKCYGASEYYPGTDEILEGMAAGEVDVFPLCPVSTVEAHLDDLKGMDIVLIPWDGSWNQDSPALTTGVEVLLPAGESVEVVYQPSPQRDLCRDLMKRIWPELEFVEGSHPTFDEFDIERGYTFVSEVIVARCRNYADEKGVEHRELSYHERAFLIVKKKILKSLRLEDVLVKIPLAKESAVSRDVHAYKACVDFVEKKLRGN